MAANSLIGTEIDGRYRIVRQLGAGGMGEVFLAEHMTLRRYEAIKIVRSRFVLDEGYLSRFRREARAINRVQHPNIVGLYDFGRLPDGRLFLTMEYAEGLSIQEHIKNTGRFSIHRAIHVIKQLSTAIGYAHDNGVIHRDLKPDNLILGNRKGVADHLKILDFGVAKIVAPGYTESAAISREGELFGTPAYIAPEQIKGVRDDPRIDIYAIGCIAYELLTGVTPFVGRPMAILESLMERDPPLMRQRCPDAKIPKALDQILMKCLQKSPENRPQRCSEIIEFIDQHASSAESSRLTRDSSFGRGSTPAQRSANDEGGTRSEKTIARETATHDRAPDHLGTEEHTFTSLSPNWSNSPETTTAVFKNRMRKTHHRIVRELAESICDLGYSKPELLVTLAELDQVRQDKSAVETELGELQHRSERSLKVSHEREASLRFALGELRFTEPATAGDSHAVSDAVGLLKRRLQLLKSQTEKDVARIIEREVALTATQSSIEDEESRLIEKLESTVAKVAPQFDDDPVVETLLSSLEKISIQLAASDLT